MLQVVGKCRGGIATQPLIHPQARQVVTHIDARWRQANDLATGGSGPDLTFLLDLDPAEGLDRAEVAGRSPDRLEGEGTVFLDRVRDGFLALAEAEPDRIHVIPAGGTVTDISEEIARRALSYLQRK